MTQTPNLAALLALRPDYVGFIFYEKSPRFAGRTLEADFLKNHFPKHTKKVGVFVNALPEAVLETARAYGLDAVQLHGEEPPETCFRLQGDGLEVIRAFRIGPGFDFRQLAAYKNCTDYFLFDAAGPAPGGNGVGFDWQLLNAYADEKPFFLAGGIGPDDARRLIEWQAQAGLPLYALDLNSRFETAPGLKDIPALQGFLQTLHAQHPAS